ncbi:MAG: hypothetical protein PHF51_05100, partial [Candidatus ainarchaeum sp.]|nr:hypothetical protein [Candidatus ainarchaeum sp.]
YLNRPADIVAASVNVENVFQPQLADYAGLRTNWQQTELQRMNAEGGLKANAGAMPILGMRMSHAKEDLDHAKRIAALEKSRPKVAAADVLKSELAQAETEAKAGGEREAASAKVELAKAMLELDEIRRKKSERLLGDLSEVAVAFARSGDPDERAALLGNFGKLKSAKGIIALNEREAALEERVSEAKSRYEAAAGKPAGESNGAIESKNHFKYAENKAEVIEALLSSAGKLLAEREAALERVGESAQAFNDAKPGREKIDAQIALEGAKALANEIDAHFDGVRRSILVASLSEGPAEAEARGARLHWAGSGRELTPNERSEVVKDLKTIYPPTPAEAVSDELPRDAVEARVRRLENRAKEVEADKAKLANERDELERKRAAISQALSEDDERIRKGEAVIVGQQAQFHLGVMADEQARQHDLKSRIAMLSLAQDRLQLGMEDPEWQRIEEKKNAYLQQLAVSKDNMEGAMRALEALPEWAGNHAAKVVALERKQEDNKYSQELVREKRLMEEGPRKTVSDALGSDYLVQRYAETMRVADALKAKQIAEPEILALEREFGGEKALERCASILTLDKNLARVYSEDPAERELGVRKLDAWRETREGARFVSELLGPDARFAQPAAGQEAAKVGGAKEFSAAVSKKVSQVEFEGKRKEMEGAAASNAQAEELMKDFGIDTLKGRDFMRALGESQLNELSAKAKAVQELVSTGEPGERGYRERVAEKIRHLKSFESTAPSGRDAEQLKLYEHLEGLDYENASKLAKYLQGRVDFESRLASLPQLTGLEQNTLEAVRARARTEAERIDRVSESAGPGRQRVIEASKQSDAFGSVESAIHDSDFTQLKRSVAGILKERASAAGVAREDAEKIEGLAEVISNWPQGSDLSEVRVGGKRVGDDKKLIDGIDSAVKDATGISGFSKFANLIRRVPFVSGQADLRTAAEAEGKPILEGLRELRDEVFNAKTAALDGIGEKKAELDFNPVLAAASSLHTEWRVGQAVTLIPLSKKLESGAQLDAGEAALLEAVTNGAVRAEAGTVAPEKARQAVPAVEREISAIGNALREAAEEQRRDIQTQLEVREALNSAKLTGQLPSDLETRADRIEKDISRADKKIGDARKDLAAAVSEYDRLKAEPGRTPSPSESKKHEDAIASAKSRVFEAEREIKALEESLYKTGYEFEYRVMRAREEQGFGGEKTKARIQEILAEFPEFEEKEAAVKAARNLVWALANSTKPPHDETEEKRSFIFRALLDSTAERELWYKNKERTMQEKAAMLAVRYGTITAAGTAIATVSPVAGLTVALGGNLLFLSLDQRGFFKNRDYDYLHVPMEKEMFFSAIMTDRASGLGYSIFPEKSMLLHRNLYRAVVEGKKRSGYGGSLSMAPPVASILPGFGLLHRFEYGFLKLAAVKPGAELRYRYGQFISGGKERFMEEYREPTYYSLAVHPDIVGTQEAKTIVVSPTQFQERFALSTGVRRLKRQYLDELRTEDLVRRGVGAMVDKGPLVYAESQEARRGAIMPPRREKGGRNPFVLRMLKAGKS